MSKHGFAAGFAMVALYDHFKNNGKNPELTKDDWETVGMVHDADYELTNKSLELHTEETTKKLRELYPNELVIAAVKGHCDKAPRVTMIAKAIYAADELTGLVVACALVQPNRKLQSVTVDSVMRKFRDKSFAAGANRDQIKTCEKELGIPLDEFVSIVLKSMQDHSSELGL